MRKSASTLYLWPGLPKLWRDGSWTGLLVAVGSGAMLNLLVASTWIWSEWLTSGQLQFGWISLSLFWCAAGLISRRAYGRRLATQDSPALQDLFRLATTEYLKGHYYEAETALTRLLSTNTADVEARLFLATLLRRARRYGEARSQLKTLERLEASVAWREEIDRESRAIDVATAKPNWLEAAVASTLPGLTSPGVSTGAAPQAKAA
jgi:hypothetical protein